MSRVLCKICETATDQFASALIRGKHKVAFFACPNCDFLQTEEPFWLAEAYKDPINRSDVGYVSRNLSMARITKSLIHWCFEPSASFADYGGGYGLFVRLMRDAGFHFFRSDKHCPNLFALDFDTSCAPATNFEVLTVFEVFEHLPDPAGELENMLAYSDNIFFTTELPPCARPAMSQWDYYGLEHGQHVSFYSRKALQALARRFKLNFYSDGKCIHLFTRKTISAWRFSLAVNRSSAFLVELVLRRPSLISSDYQKAVQAMVEK